EPGEVMIREALSGREICTFAVPEGVVRSLTFGPDGRHLAFVDEDQSLRIWDIQSRRVIKSLPISSTGDILNSRPSSVAYSSDGRWLAAACSPWGRDAEVKIWDTSTDGRPITLRGHKGEIWSTVFSSDNRFLVTAGGDHTVRVWSLNSGREELV